LINFSKNKNISIKKKETFNNFFCVYNQVVNERSKIWMLFKNFTEKQVD